jgi:hypothetical protein
VEVAANPLLLLHRMFHLTTGLTLSFMMAQDRTNPEYLHSFSTESDAQRTANPPIQECLLTAEDTDTLFCIFVNASQPKPQKHEIGAGMNNWLHSVYSQANTGTIR